MLSKGTQADKITPIEIGPMKEMKTSPKEMASQQFITCTAKRQRTVEVAQEAVAFKIQKKLFPRMEVMSLKSKRAK